MHGRLDPTILTTQKNPSGVCTGKEVPPEGGDGSEYQPGVTRSRRTICRACCRPRALLWERLIPARSAATEAVGTLQCFHDVGHVSFKQPSGDQEWLCTSSITMKWQSMEQQCT